MNFQCPICGMFSASVFLSRENVPVHQNLLFKKEHDAVKIARGTLSISICHNCGFVFNADFDASLLSYDKKYENTQSYSAVFEEYLDDSIDYLINQRGVKNRRIIEVGCGKGHFLQKLIERGNNSGVGFDPSYIGPLEKLDGRLQFRREFYDESSADLVADIVICRHVIEHIGSPLDMLRTVQRALVNSPQAQVFFETPDVEWILKNQVVWDFFYEHCTYFSGSSIRLAFEKSGFLVENIKTIFGNQYFWVEARPTLKSIPLHLNIKQVAGLAELSDKFAEANTSLISLWKNRLIEMRSHGDITVWGAGAKGVTFANLFDPKRKLISCMIDINPQKQNKFLPGTGHPILNYHTLIQNNIKSVVILNPNYRREIESLLKETKVKDVEIFEFTSGDNNENSY